jgi:hypothetical protein
MHNHRLSGRLCQGASSHGRSSKGCSLTAAFGLPPSYLLDLGKVTSVLDEEVLEALADETVGAILRESARLPEREKEIVLGIVRQFGSQIDDA